MILTMVPCSPPLPQYLGQKWKRRRANSGLFRIQPRALPPSGGFLKFVFVAKTLIFKISNSGRMVNIHFDEVLGDASRPPDYSNHPKNN